MEKELWTASRLAIAGKIDAIEDETEKEAELKARLAHATIAALPDMVLLSPFFAKGCRGRAVQTHSKAQDSRRES